MDDQASLPNLPALHAGAGAKKKAKDGTDRGRPRGSKNKERTQSDVLAYIKAKHGVTPGQQSADLWLITKKDIAQARKWAKTGGFVASYPAGALVPDVRILTPLELAHKFKVYKLQIVYGLSAKEAMTFLYNAGQDLTPLTNNKQAVADKPEDPDADRAAIDAIPVDAEFMQNIPQNQQLDLELEE